MAAAEFYDSGATVRLRATAGGIGGGVGSYADVPATPAVIAAFPAEHDHYVVTKAIVGTVAPAIAVTKANSGR